MRTAKEVRQELFQKRDWKNDRKPPLVSDGLLSAKQFSFAPICPDDRIGDSGNSLLAQSEKGPARQLFVKHTRLHAAANAYIYAKLAQAFFFFLSQDNRQLFATDFPVDSVYFTHAQTCPTFERIQEQAMNWQEYFRLRVLHDICRFVKHIGQRTRKEKARRAVSWGRGWSGGCGQRVA